MLWSFLNQNLLALSVLRKELEYPRHPEDKQQARSQQDYSAIWICPSGTIDAAPASGLFSACGCRRKTSARNAATNIMMLAMKNMPCSDSDEDFIPSYLQAKSILLLANNAAEGSAEDGEQVVVPLLAVQYWKHVFREIRSRRLWETEPGEFRRKVVEGQLALCTLQLGEACRDQTVNWERLQGLSSKRKQWEAHGREVLGREAVERMKDFESNSSAGSLFFVVTDN